MRYQVLILRRAEQELRDAADWIAEHSPSAAQRWFNGFVDALCTLDREPQRCGLAPESASSRCELRQLIYRPKTRRAYRAIFTIAGDQVRILRIRGAGQDLLTAEELG